MYRIEVATGEETVFRTIEELAVGIRNGVVTSRSRIYHNASQKWLPIGLHPHYKKALELPAAKSAQPATPTPVPARPRLRPRPEVHAEPAPMPAPEPEPTRPAPPSATKARVPAPVTSPVVAMQQEVLRDLPVVIIPDPLPWTSRSRPPQPEPEPALESEPEPEPEHQTREAAVPPPAPTAHLPPIAHLPNPFAERIAPTAPLARIAQAVQAQPTATVTYAPLGFAEPPAPARHEPDEPAHARPTARRSRRASGRPLLLLGAAAGLVLAAHFALTAMPPASAGTSDMAEPAEAAPEPAANLPAEAAAEPAAPAAPTAPAPRAAETEPPARVTSAPARVPMTPGPAFSGSAPARPGADPGVAPRATAPAAPPAPAAAAPEDGAITPAPAAIELALPDLPPDSVMPAARSGDTLAMKKILRALNGTKQEAPAAP